MGCFTVCGVNPISNELKSVYKGVMGLKTSFKKFDPTMSVQVALVRKSCVRILDNLHVPRYFFPEKDEFYRYLLALGFKRIDKHKAGNQSQTIFNGKVKVFRMCI